MNPRSWTSWCAAGLLATGLAAGEDAPKSINYSLAETGLPAPNFLKSVKPAPSQVSPSAPPSALKTAAPKPTIEVKAAPKTENTPKPVAAALAPALKDAVAPLLPPAPAKAKTPAVEPAVVKATDASVRTAITPVAAILPATDDHLKCLECLKALSGSPIESDRKAALTEMAKLHAWKHMKSAYMVLRRVALTEYNTKMRADAVKLLGEAMTEHALAADTLKLSAQYDSDAAIRATAFAQLEKLASMPPDRVIR